MTVQTPNEIETAKARSPFSEAWEMFRKNHAAMVALVVLFAIVIGVAVVCMLVCLVVCVLVWLFVCV